MLPRADIISVNPVARPDPVAALEHTGDARQEAFQRSLAGLVGKSMAGEVLSKLTDGSYLVRVADASARMLLPPGTKVGTEVPLTLVSLSPRPTFQVEQRGGGQAALVYTEAGPPLLPGAPGTPARAAPLTYQEGPQLPVPAPRQDGTAPAQPGDTPRPGGADTVRPQSHAAALLNKAPLVPAEQLPPIDPKSTPATISEGARMIASVLSTAQQAGKSAAVHAAAPIVDRPGLAPEKLAAGLKEALASSGLFYESHVAEWAEGKRPLGDLVREPQMQKALNTAAPEAAARQASPTTDPATAQFINQQLSTQEQARIAWQGLAWPGQPMQWEVSRDAPEGRGQNGEGTEAPWRSSVRFRFAGLGEVDATVVLAGNQLHIQVSSGTDSTGALLRAQAGLLAGALEAAGTPLASLDIRGPAAQADGDG